MNTWLDGIAIWLTGVGIHPVLGAFVAGFLLAVLARTVRASSGVAPNAGMFTSSTVSLAHGSGSLTVNGQTVPLEPTVLAAVVETIKSGHLLEAIKLVREKTGLGLAESKLLVDTVAKSALLR